MYAACCADLLTFLTESAVPGEFSLAEHWPAMQAAATKHASAFL
jgi:hypothetical protein